MAMFWFLAIFLPFSRKNGQNPAAFFPPIQAQHIKVIAKVYPVLPFLFFVVEDFLLFSCKVFFPSFFPFSPKDLGFRRGLVLGGFSVCTRHSGSQVLTLASLGGCCCPEPFRSVDDGGTASAAALLPAWPEAFASWARLACASVTQLLDPAVLKLFGTGRTSLIFLSLVFTTLFR